MNTVSIEAICDRWSSLDRPLFKGRLISDDGCCCAQGDVLRQAGWSDEALRDLTQRAADKKVAEILGISLAHSVLLRNINDGQAGCPQDVLASPERVLGSEADKVLKFWHLLDTFDWSAAGFAAAGFAADFAARNAAGFAAARDAARNAAARAAAGVDAFEVVWETAWFATWEIQGAAVMRERGQAFYFLPLFGVADPDLLA